MAKTLKNNVARKERYSTEKRGTDSTDIIYTGIIGYPRTIGFVNRISGNVFSSEGGAHHLGFYGSKIAAKYAVIASFERLGGRIGESA